MDWNPWSKKDKLDEPIEKVLQTLQTLDPNSEQYSRNVVFLERLTKLKADTKRKFTVSPDTIIIVLGNLLGIAIIVKAEQSTPLNSKGFGFLKQKTPRD